MRGSTFSMPSSEIIVLGSAEVRRALPSFSVMETMPVSAMAKLAPVMPTSAVMYFSRRARRAIMVSSSGLSVLALPRCFSKRSLMSCRVRCIAGKTMW